jgi:hypothetical protein
MYERPTGNPHQDNKPNFKGISKDKSPTLRDLLFSGIAVIVFGLGFHHMYSEGIETGILRVGGRSIRTIIKTNDPESFIFWSELFFGLSIFCWVVGFILILAALKKWKNGKNIV